MQPTLPVATIVAPVSVIWSSLRRPSFFRHLGLRQVISARGPAAKLGFVERDELEERDHGQELPGLVANLLAVAEVAGVVISHLGRDRELGGDWPEFHEKFGDVADLGDEFLCGLIVRKEVSVILEHRAAAGGVDDDGVEAVGVEGLQVRSGEIERGGFRAGMIMDRAAAALRSGRDDFAAVGLEDSGGRGVGLGKHRVGHATEKERDPRPLWADRRQHGRQAAP